MGVTVSHPSRNLVPPSTPGMEGWMVFALFAVILLVVVGLLVYCFWRFFAKRRGKKDGDCQKEIDEQAILDGEEEMDVNEDDPLKAPAKEYLGKLQYELKYDFNTQTLSVTVCQAMELPPWIWGEFQTLMSRCSSYQRRRGPKNLK